MANSVDTDEMAHHELSHLGLQRYRYWSVGMKGLTFFGKPTQEQNIQIKTQTELSNLFS